jgi:hypothetical protein
MKLTFIDNDTSRLAVVCEVCNELITGYGDAYLATSYEAGIHTSDPVPVHGGACVAAFRQAHLRWALELLRLARDRLAASLMPAGGTP